MRNEYIITLHVEADDDGDMPTRDMPSQIVELFERGPVKLLCDFGLTKIKSPKNRRPNFEEVEAVVRKHGSELARQHKAEKEPRKAAETERGSDSMREYIVTLFVEANEDGDMMDELSDAFRESPIKFLGVFGATKIELPEEIETAMERHKSGLIAE